MARTTYVMRNGKLVEKRLAGPRSMPAIHSDTMDPIQSQLDGKVYDSKSQYLSHVKARGHEVVGNEVGYLMRDEPMPEPTGVDRSVYEAMQRLGME